MDFAHFLKAEAVGFLNSSILQIHHITDTQTSNDFQDKFSTIAHTIVAASLSWSFFSSKEH